MDKKEHFGSKFGAMAAIVGSAVGLGNIWRFPYMAGANGGGAFIVMYLGFVLMVGLPIVLSEFSIGRAGKGNASSSFSTLARGTKWYLIGILGVVTAFTIMTFYSIIAGWTAHFLKEAILNRFAHQSEAELTASFKSFVNSGWQPIIWACLTVALTATIVSRGVKKGVEKFNKILMPTLVAIILVMCINSMTLSGFGEGMDFLFNPDLSLLTWQSALDALGQVFFTLSVGMGVMITYGAYVRQEENMVKSKAIVVLIDTSIAIIAGIAIFPAVFTYNIPPTSGPDLVFLVLPNIFSQMPGGYFFAILFFVLLLIAAVTSTISLCEVITSYFTDKFRVSRRVAVWVAASVIMVLGSLSAISQMDGSHIRIAGLNQFDFFDTLSSNYMLIGGGLGIVIFAGWFFGRRNLYNIMTYNGRYNLGFIFPVLMFFIRFVAPLAIAVLFLSKLGIFKM